MCKQAKPHWPDACRHNRRLDRFLGTFTYEGTPYDVFVYQDNALDAKVPDMHLCIRYGAECEQYISPGNVEALVKRALENPGVYDSGEYTLILPFAKRWLEENHVSESQSS